VGCRRIDLELVIELGRCEWPPGVEDAGL